MSDFQTDDYSEDSDQANEPGWRKELAKRAKEAEARAQELETKLSTFQRKDAFRDAGLDPSNKQHALLMKSYDGELTAEAIRKEAEEYGFVQPQEPPVTQDELSAHARMDRASLDAPAATPVGTSEEQMSKLANASSREEFWAQAKGLGVVTKG